MEFIPNLDKLHCIDSSITIDEKAQGPFVKMIKAATSLVVPQVSLRVPQPSPPPRLSPPPGIRFLSKIQ